MYNVNVNVYYPIPIHISERKRHAKRGVLCSYYEGEIKRRRKTHTCMMNMIYGNEY